MDNDGKAPLLHNAATAASPRGGGAGGRRSSLLASCSSPRSLSLLLPLPEDDELFFPDPSLFSPTPTSSSFKDRLIFGPSSSSPPLSPTSTSTSTSTLTSTPLLPTRFQLHRSRTAPAMAALNEIAGPHQNPSLLPSPVSPSFLHAFLFLLLYLSLGVAVYTLARGHFSSRETHPVVDALYFSIVTMCTIGYGDITPSSPLSKGFSILFVLVGFGFIDILLSGALSYFLDLQESLLLSTIKAGKLRGRRYIFDSKKGRMRIRLKVALALGAVALCVGVGTVVLRLIEGLGWLDSFYLAVMSVTTVGYGDHSFKTLPGRLFASFWLLFSTLAVARAFLYLAEARIDKRHRMIAKWILGRAMTVAEFLAADIDNNGFVSKSEFVVYKLKEMGKISEKDIMQICTQFQKLDVGNCGKITLADLIESHHG